MPYEIKPLAWQWHFDDGFAETPFGRLCVSAQSGGWWDWYWYRESDFHIRCQSKAEAVAAAEKRYREFMLGGLIECK